MNINQLLQLKQDRKKISMLTCYDYSMAKIINQSHIDMILVGDSAAMVMHGHSSTLPMLIDTLVTHVAAVARGAPDKFIVGDMPFLSYRKGLNKTMQAVGKIMQAGAHAVKLEGLEGNRKIIKHIVASGVPVMGHIGLTPQSVNTLGGYRVQGKHEQDKIRLIKEAKELEKAGCFAIVLECVPALLAAQISQSLHCITIGIGAGDAVDGQVLVVNDMLGMSSDFKPKFVRRYLHTEQLFLQAFNQYDQEVKSKKFPSQEESYQ